MVDMPETGNIHMAPYESKNLGGKYMTSCLVAVGIYVYTGSVPNDQYMPNMRKTQLST
jgi:hypothetical protein